jgi:hypothetical protein
MLLHQILQWVLTAKASLNIKLKSTHNGKQTALTSATLDTPGLWLKRRQMFGVRDLGRIPEMCGVADPGNPTLQLINYYKSMKGRLQ